MKITIEKVIGFSCPSKYLLMFDGKPIVFANTESRFAPMIGYVEGYNDGKEIRNKKILNKLMKWRKENERTAVYVEQTNQVSK